MLLVMKEDIALDPVRDCTPFGIILMILSRGVDPIDVSLFGSDAEMLHPNDFAHLIEQFGHVRDFTTKSGFIPRICG